MSGLSSTPMSGSRGNLVTARFSWKQRRCRVDFFPAWLEDGSKRILRGNKRSGLFLVEHYLAEFIDFDSMA